MSLPWLPLLLAINGVALDDFESSTLQSPGPWDYVQDFTGGGITPTPVAAHRGLQGVRFVDTGGGNSEGEEEVIGVTPLPGGTTLHSRAWVRLSPVSPDADTSLLIINTIWSDGGFSMSSLSVDSATNRLFVTTAQTAMTALDDWPTTGTLPSAEWHLLEMQSSGLGTTNGCVRAGIDGVSVLERCGLNWSDATTPISSVGIAWQNPQLPACTLDMDDVVLDPVPHATRIALEPSSGPLHVGDCVALTVRGFDAWADESPSAFDELVPVTLTGPQAGLFSDATCAAAVTTFELKAGQSTAQLWLKPAAAGDLVVTPQPLSVVLALDGGVGHWTVLDSAMDAGAPTDAGTMSVDGGNEARRVTNVGCGCNAAPSFGLVLAPLLSRFGRRLRHRRLLAQGQ